MTYTLAQAAEATGRSKSTIFRAIKSGKLSAARDELTQGWLIDPAELHRLYPVVASDDSNDAPRKDHATDGMKREIELLRERLADKDAVIDDLRRRLDAEGEERRRLTAILTDQRGQAIITPPPETAPAKRSWWPFGRRG